MQQVTNDKGFHIIKEEGTNTEDFFLFLKTEKLALTARSSTTLKLCAKMFYEKRFSLLPTPTELKQQNLQNKG